MVSIARSSTVCPGAITLIVLVCVVNVVNVIIAAAAAAATDVDATSHR